MATYELLYFPARGRGEVIRLLFACAQVPFTDTGVTDWPALKPKTPMGQLPVLVERSDDGSELQIPQSGAIVRHLARRFDLYGKTDQQKTMSDYIADAVADQRGKVMPVAFAGMFNTPQEIVDKYWSDLPQALSLFERLLGQSTSAASGWFVGESPTFADVAMFDLLDTHLGMKADCLSEFPGLKGFVGRFRELPGVAKYLAERRT